MTENPETFLGAALDVAIFLFKKNGSRWAGLGVKFELNFELYETSVLLN